MSGIEVAGLLLGVLPLLISGLEHYRGVAERADLWWKFKRRYVKCKRELEYHKIEFSANLQELLLPLICEDDQIDLLMADAGGITWQDQELEQRLKARLSTTYDLYVHCIEDIKEVIEKLTREMGLDEFSQEIHAGKISSAASTLETILIAYKDQKRRLKFALGESVRERLFEEFAKSNEKLRNLLERSDKLAEIKSTRKPKDKAIGKLTALVWKRAATLYRLLYHAWSCNCQALHKANLRLEDRQTEDSLLSFDITFLHSGSLGGDAGAPWTMQNTKIIVTDRIEAPLNFSVPPAPSPTPSMNTLSSTSSIMSPTSQKKSSFFRRMKAKKAMFVEDQVVCLSTVTTLASSQVDLDLHTASHVHESTIDQPREMHKEIDDLCNTLRSTDLAEKSDCCGILNATNEQFQVFPQSKNIKEQQIITLEQLLESATDIKLTRRQRYGLAFALASSEVQLHATPWLSERWNKGQVLFFKNEIDKKTALWDQSRLAADFAAPITNDTLEPNTDRDLQDLAILLLELCFGCKFENTEIRQKYPVLPEPQNAFLDLAAAHELCGQVAEEAGPEYAAAVEWCLRKNHPTSLSDAEWRMGLYENVVQPLQQCHGYLNKTRN